MNLSGLGLRVRRAQPSRSRRGSTARILASVRRRLARWIYPNVKTPDFSDPRARRAWVNYQLKLSGRSLADVARELGVARHAPSLALSRPYPRMERAIAHATGVAVHILFPERYSPNGQRSIRFGRPVKGELPTQEETSA